ncbi:dihydrodipicolinate synthase family protein, partial [Streptomyces sp. P9(2023)]|uniref:dihydrodipicolinate synthase family protein n=1 Tax=Streptomyces sp. P9(2023) TaxID=3064394 RepID=UPI0028F412F4
RDAENGRRAARERLHAGARHRDFLVIASLSTVEAVAMAKAAAEAGAEGLMVLPPYVYTSDWREMKAHVSAVIGATKLSCLLYNNPV